MIEGDLPGAAARISRPNSSATAARLMKPFSWFDEVIRKRTSARFAPSRRRAMIEVIVAVGVLFSISIFVVHAFDAYRTR